MSRVILRHYTLSPYEKDPPRPQFWRLKTMIKIHHLNFSRSTRIIWLMEELGEASTRLFPIHAIPTHSARRKRSSESIRSARPL